MDTNQQRQIHGTNCLTTTAIWRPVATHQVEQWLAMIARRRICSRVKPHRFVTWLHKNSVRIIPINGLHPLNLLWFYPQANSTTQVQAATGLWRHEYIHTQTVVQDSKGNVVKHASPWVRNITPSSADMTLTERWHHESIHTQTVVQDSTGNAVKHASPSVKNITQSSADMTLLPQPAVAIKAVRYVDQVMRAEKILNQHTLANTSVNLATNRQPRKELSPAAYLGGINTHHYAPDRNQLTSQLEINKADEGNVSSRLFSGQETVPHAPHLATDLAPRRDKLAMQNRSNVIEQSTVPVTKQNVLQSNFVDNLFDRAMQSQPLAGLDLQLLPVHTTPAAVADADHQQQRLSVSPNSKTTAENMPVQPPLQFSQSDVNRVADKVSHILKLKERLERERWGKY